MNDTLLEVRNLTKHFPAKSSLFGPRNVVHALDGVTFAIQHGETLGLVGESGSGKSTAGRAILRLLEPTEGTVFLDGQRIDDLPAGKLRPIRKRIQVIFQDPFSSLTPRMRVRELLSEPLRNFGIARSAAAIEARVKELMAQVNLPVDAIDRLPHEFSGGQRQRIGIARALAAEPDLIVCDEATSALDVSVKAQIINLLISLQRRLNLSLLFISHDLAIVEQIAHRVAVLYLGQIVEIADRREIFAASRHPYTRALLAAVPVPDPAAPRNAMPLKGEIPSSINPPSGCRFHTRCPVAIDRCKTQAPLLRELAPGHLSACHLNE